MYTKKFNSFPSKKDKKGKNTPVYMLNKFERVVNINTMIMMVEACLKFFKKYTQKRNSCIN